MAEGNERFLGAVPLKGESEIFQQDPAVDILTITGVLGQTGDFLVLQNSGGTERFVVDKDGDITLGGDLSITGSFGVTGSSVFTGAITQTGGDITFNGDVSIQNSLLVGTSGTTPAITLFGALTQSNGAVNVKGAITHASTLHQTGAATLAGALTMTGGTGDIVLKKGAVGQTAFSKLQLAVLNTTPTTTTLFSRGDLWIQKATTDLWEIACYIGPTTTPLMYRMRKDTFVTLGSAS